MKYTLIILLFFFSCKTLKTKQQRTTTTKIDSAVALVSVERKVSRLKEFKDTLQGIIPLPELTTGDTLFIPVRSRAIDLQLKITKQGVSYVAAVNQATRETINEQSDSVAQQVSKQQNTKVKELSTKVKKPPNPFFTTLWVGLAIVLLMIILIQITKKWRIL